MSKKIAIITGFHKSNDFLKVLFEYLNKQNFKNFDVYIYNSLGINIDGFEKLDFNYHNVILKKNLGFAGGNNAAILFAKQKGNYDYYVLVNDDTKPDPDWLKCLVETAQNYPKAGAISSKMVFYEKFITIIGKTITSTTLDARELGVKFYNNSKFSNCYYNKKIFKNGFYHQEEDSINEFRWTNSEFEISIPINISNKNLDSFELNLFIHKNSSITNQILTIQIGNTFICEIKLIDSQIHYSISIPAKIILENAYYIIQNAGSTFDEMYNGKDIGSGEKDIGQYDSIRPIDMFCGGSCLLTKRALEKTGLFNPHYFCYYEDSDLSLRLKKNGFDIIYAPTSLLLHHHSGSSKEWSPFFTYHVFRNKIIFATKNFGLKAFLITFKERYMETLLFYKRSSNSKFKDEYSKHRLKLNLVIIKDALKGIIKYNPTKF